MGNMMMMTQQWELRGRHRRAAAVWLKRSVKNQGSLQTRNSQLPQQLVFLRSRHLVNVPEEGSRLSFSGTAAA
jgi:hypothetical protein